MVGVDRKESGEIEKIKVEVIPSYDKKLKGYIHWVSKDCALDCTVNLYSVLFLIDDIKKAGDKWLEYMNPNSLVVKRNAKIWNFHKEDPVESRY
jgi:hypothetical protein